jgi:peptidyl-prolyl cis-trans isomerase B (cyclophilin B)
MQAVASAILMFSVLFPAKTWFSPDQPITVEVRADQPVMLMLLDFLGKPLEPRQPAQFPAGQTTVNLRDHWQQLQVPGTYLLLAVPQGAAPAQFLGTPLVIQVREDKRRDAPPGPMVIKVEPLSYAVISTDHGEMTVMFYYDVAPNTVANFISLAQGGYYDGLSFHRIVPGFVIQGGDPRGDGTGGPGYHIEAEFSNREHREGVLSMARQGDPIERQGVMPRPEAANSAGSQFFICLDYARTRQLDGRYTAFGKVVQGFEVAQEIAKTPIADPETGRPQTPQIIRAVRILPVTRDNNPYAQMLNLSPVATTSPAATASPAGP